MGKVQKSLLRDYVPYYVGRNFVGSVWMHINCHEIQISETFWMKHFGSSTKF